MTGEGRRQKIQFLQTLPAPYALRDLPIERPRQQHLHPRKNFIVDPFAANFRRGLFPLSSFRRNVLTCAPFETDGDARLVWLVPSGSYGPDQITAAIIIAVWQLSGNVAHPPCHNHRDYGFDYHSLATSCRRCCRPASASQGGLQNLLPPLRSHPISPRKRTTDVSF